MKMGAAPSALERHPRKGYHSAFTILHRQNSISSFIFVPSIPSAPPHSVCSREHQHAYPPEPADLPLYPIVDEDQGGYTAVTDKVVKPFKESLVWVFDNIIRTVRYLEIPRSSLLLRRMPALESQFVETLEDNVSCQVTIRCTYQVFNQKNLVTGCTFHTMGRRSVYSRRVVP